MPVRHEIDAGRVSAVPREPAEAPPSTEAAPDSAGEAASLATSYRIATAHVVRQRLDLTVVLFVVLVGSVVVTEHVCFGETRGRSARLFYILEVLACLAAVVVNRHGHRWVPPAPLAALLNATLAALMAGYNASVGAHVERLAMALVVLLSGLVVLLPWGVRPQLFVAAASLVSLCLTLHSSAADVAVSALIGLMTSATTSVCGAFFLDRYRWDAFVQAALQREEAEIAALLVHVGQTLSAHVGDPDMLEQVNRLSVDALDCEWSATFLWDERRQALRLHASVGLRSDLHARLEQLDLPADRLCHHLAARPGCVLDLRDAVAQHLVPRELIPGLGTAPALCVPIARRDEVIGMFMHGFAAWGAPPAARQRRLALGIAHATAIALENARLITDLQGANRLKSEFVSTMSHELRTPLNVITGYSEMLAEETLGPLTAEQHELVARMRRSTLELFELVSATLDLGRIESGRETITRTAVDLEDLFLELDRELESVVPAAVTLRWRNEVASRSVVSDRMKLKTLLKNLSGNALKFTNAGHVAVTATWSADVLTLRVEDTGVGMAPEHLPMIFEMFRQIDGSFTRRFGGVGLGLHIVKRLVDLLEGTIGVESTPGVGTTFTVAIPAVVPAEAAIDMQAQRARAVA